MNFSMAFSLGLLIAGASGFAAAVYLKSHMKDILLDLCGSTGRAEFWMAFCSVILVLVPLIFSMQFHMAADEKVPVILQLSYQLKWVFVGLVASVMSIGTILAIFIRVDLIRSLRVQGNRST